MSGARVMTCAELMASMNPPLPGAGVDGTRRTAYMGLAGSTFQTNLVVMPEDQRSTSRQSDIEHVIYVLEGSFAFDVGETSFELAAMDQIFVPIGVRWEYRNTFAGPSTFLSITCV